MEQRSRVREVVDGGRLEGGGGLNRTAIALVLGLPAAPSQLLIVQVGGRDRLDEVLRQQ